MGEGSSSAQRRRAEAQASSPWGSLWRRWTPRRLQPPGLPRCHDGRHRRRSKPNAPRPLGAQGLHPHAAVGFHTRSFAPPLPFPGWILGNRVKTSFPSHVFHQGWHKPRPASRGSLCLLSPSVEILSWLTKRLGEGNKGGASSPPTSSSAPARFPINNTAPTEHALPGCQRGREAWQAEGDGQQQCLALNCPPLRVDPAPTPSQPTPGTCRGLNHVKGLSENKLEKSRMSFQVKPGAAEVGGRQAGRKVRAESVVI